MTAGADQDDWGQALPLPGASKPAAASTSATKTPSVAVNPDARYSRPLGEDPVYQAALQQARAANQLLPVTLNAYQFSTQPGVVRPIPVVPQSTTAVPTPQAAASSSSTAFAIGSPATRQLHGAARGVSLGGSSSGGSTGGAAKTQKSTAPMPIPIPPPPPLPIPSSAGTSPATALGSSPGAGFSKKQSKTGADKALSGPDAQQARVAGGKENAGIQEEAARATPERAAATVNGSSAKAQPQASPMARQASSSSVKKAGAQRAGSSAGLGSPNTYTVPIFDDYLPQSELQSMVKTGAAFTGKLRINATDRTEAYMTVAGLPHDVVIRGDFNQNRAWDGDEVVVEILPMALWYKVYRHMSQELQDSMNRSKVFLERGGVFKGQQAKQTAQEDLPDAFLLTPWADTGSVERSKEALTQCLNMAPAGALRISGRVVGITAPSKRREQLVGVLQAGGMSEQGERWLWLLPLDPCTPRCLVTLNNARALSEELRKEAEGPLEGPDAHRTLVSARVASWDSRSEYPMVEIRQSLGQAGEIESETAAILSLQGVRDIEFADSVLACLPKTPWSMTADEMAGRRDFRSHRIFSIDPATARDLDDALHISPVPGRPGHWHVGVHIADVAHFIPPYSALDYEAGTRATSVYLVQRVIPMLPRLLCEELCSLNPGVSRFAFSIEWELDEEGQVVSQWVGRSIIRSRAKLAYPMVQAMIEGVFNPAECTAALHDGATWDQVIEDCLALNKLARCRRKARFENGALRLDGVKLTFGLDKDGNPGSCGQYRGAEANQLVEEFMLLANMRVAELIANVLPDRAMLRCHPPPNARKMTELQALADAHQLQLNCTSAGALHESLTALRQTCEDSDVVELIVQMATKPMQLALYFCTGEQPDREQWAHYALAVPEYTHFTSPIRRYPDVVVHRLLAAALQLQPQLTFTAPDYYAAGQPGVIVPHTDAAAAATPQQGSMADRKAAVVKQLRLFDTQLTGKVAEHCNERRLAARNAQDASLKLYLCVLLRRHPVVTHGVVCQLGGDKHVQVYLPAYGMDIRLFIEDYGGLVTSYYDNGSKTLLLQAASVEQGSQDNQRTNNRNNSSKNGRGANKAPNWVTWMNELPEINMHKGTQPAMLPLQLRMFDHVPVVLYSPLRIGTISRVEGRLLLSPEQLQPAVPQLDQEALQAVQAKVDAALAAAAAAAPPQAPAAAAPAAPPAVRALLVEPESEVAATPDSFCIPYEATLND